MVLTVLKALRSRLFGDFMAIMHCDGGHYLSTHGPQKAFEDARTIRNNMARELDLLRGAGGYAPRQ